MRKHLALCLATTFLASATTAFAQGAQSTAATNEERRPATTTTAGDTGLWFVPTAEVLLNKKWSVSFYQVNTDDGQGFTDVNRFPVTFGYGIGNKFELFGSWNIITRIDRDTRPLFFTSSAAAADSGTGGGIVADYPQVRQGWSGNKLGDIWLGGKVNLLAASKKPLGLGVRGQIKLPVGDEDSGASSGATDFQFDGIVSNITNGVDVSGYVGFMVRGSPEGFDLTNGLRWGAGVGIPGTSSIGLKGTLELFGEKYFDTTILAPAGFVSEDGSIAPLETVIKHPVILALGLTWQHSNGFFIGGGASHNFNMEERNQAAGPGVGPFTSISGDRGGFQVRIGFHPGTKNRTAPPPPPPPPPAPVAAANRPPVVRANCDPCRVEVGRTAIVSADAQDPDGDPLTYAWKAGAGSLATASARQSNWTAPNQPGPVQFTVTVNDGKGGTASANVSIEVVAPPRKEYSFEDVHFDFDRFNLRPDALKILDDAVAAMQANADLRLTIEGHTCNIGTTEYNVALGEKRAGSVRDYLTSRGINASRLNIVSYGEERPKYDNDNGETRRLNRRAALVVRLQ
ncbi:MAG TPA: OmpA family protein [Vicinamibacterales bacterium]|nr:OmpA family protein [Vicinamibacterales bacterium]